MMRAMKFGALIGVFGLMLGLSACNKDSSSYGPSYTSPPNNNQPNTVSISNFAFGPASMTVKKGTSITWQNYDSAVHTATSDSGAWDTGDIAQGGSKSITFNTAGSFPYHCTHHPMMTGTIIVQ